MVTIVIWDISLLTPRPGCKKWKRASNEKWNLRDKWSRFIFCRSNCLIDNWVWQDIQVPEITSFNAFQKLILTARTDVPSSPIWFQMSNVHVWGWIALQKNSFACRLLCAFKEIFNACRWQPESKIRVDDSSGQSSASFEWNSVNLSDFLSN